MSCSSLSEFAALHRKGDPLLLPNAWDVASAVVIADAGARAVALTSAGVAWSLGVPDGADLGVDRLAPVVRAIASAVPVPVTADLEAGYDDVAQTTAEVVAAGAVGVNLEDRAGGVMLDPREQARRLAAVRAAGGSVWINARTDTYLGGVEPGDRFDATLARAHAYAEAGADSLFVPGVADLAVIARLVELSPLPVAVMVWAGAPGVAALAGTGVARISLGSAIAQAAYGLAARAAREMLHVGSYDSTADGVDYAALNARLRSG